MTLPPKEARELDVARLWSIPLDRVFHALPHDDVANIIAAADLAKYRKPAASNGSRARYYHARLVQLANRPA